MRNNKFNVISEEEKQRIMNQYSFSKSKEAIKEQEEEKTLQALDSNVEIRIEDEDLKVISPRIPKIIYINEGIEGLINKYPLMRSLHIKDSKPVPIPNNIRKLVNLYFLSISPALNIPITIVKCKELEIVVFTNTDSKLDLYLLDELPNIDVINVTGSPNVIGIDLFVLIGQPGIYRKKS